MVFNFKGSISENVFENIFKYKLFSTPSASMYKRKIEMMNHF